MLAALKVIMSPAHGGSRLRHLGIGFVLLAAAAMPRPATAQALFVACDNGLRCVQAPCPSKDVVLVPSGRRYAKTDPDLSALPPADAARRDLANGLYSGRLVLSGTVEDGPPVRITATKVLRRATAHEAALCRRR